MKIRVSPIVDTTGATPPNGEKAVVSLANIDSNDNKSLIFSEALPSSFKDYEVAAGQVLAVVIYKDAP